MGSDHAVDVELLDLMDNSLKFNDSLQSRIDQVFDVSSIAGGRREELSNQPVVEYRLYKRRFAGAAGVVIMNVIGGMNWPWFGPIANNMVSEFGITLDQVNWIGNINSLVYLPVAILVPMVLARYGLKKIFMIGATLLLISAWVRFAGTARSLSTEGAYALLVVGQLFAAAAQPIFQILGPKYSETWFDLQGRTTATMVFSIANPIGGAVGQLISPLVGDTRQSILVLGILSSVVFPASLLIGSAPPTPPTFSGGQTSPTLLSTLRVAIGRERPGDAHMTSRERIDFAILLFIFGVLVAATNTFGILSGEVLVPQGYSAEIAGLMGAALLLSGIIAAIVSAPLFDRVLTHHLGITVRILCPIVAAAWLSTVWAVKPHNTAGLFAVVVVIGISAVTMLPVGLELGCELTRNADGSSALLWFSGNLFGVMFVLVQSALRAGPDANPPLNMRNALIFNAAFVCAAASMVFLFRGKQVRREMDEQKFREVQNVKDGGIIA